MNEKITKVEKEKTQLELKENNFWETLDDLPTELAKKWESAYTEAEDIETFFDGFDEFCKLRAKVFEGEIELYGEVSPEVMEEINLVKKVIDETYGNPEFFLGSGRTARVYMLPIAPSICVKYMFYESPVDISIDAEADILSRLRSFKSSSGIRTPIPYFKQTKSKDRHFYGMEKIKGKDLFQIVNFAKQNENLIRIAKTLDKDVVLKKLKNFIDEVYVSFGITHGDLKQSNVMMDEEANFYVIDFGKGAVEEVGENHEERVINDKTTLQHEVREFFKAIDKFDLDSINSVANPV